jgi:hypothetical protein
MPLTGSLEISLRVIYHGVLDNNNKIRTGDEELQPITFHTWAFKPLEGQFRVYHRRRHDQPSLETKEAWETFYDDGHRHHFWDNPDKLIKVSENPNGRFPTLFPGESWSDFWTVDGELLPDDRKPGERLRYQFKGNTLDWWDWGTAEAHAHTTVTLPGSGVEPISNPRDNEGRPKVVVPASNIVEWTVVGD